MPTDKEISERTQKAFTEGRAQAEAAAARSKQDTANDVDLELKALDRCSKLLAPLPPEAASRVLLYLARRFDPPRRREPSLHEVLGISPEHAARARAEYGDGGSEAE